MWKLRSRLLPHGFFREVRERCAEMEMSQIRPLPLVAGIFASQFITPSVAQTPPPNPQNQSQANLQPAVHDVGTGGATTVPAPQPPAAAPGMSQTSGVGTTVGPAG
ncbi:MAG TPA: hypothetical protein VEI50_13435 [Nitrospiraceae bacterium]|nr:hypothetical protein [Nitrospiraceae bacterium]